MREVYDQKWYTPLEIARLGLIKNSRGDQASVLGNYNFILKQIKAGRLRAKNYSTGTKRPNWLVSEEEIKRFLNMLTKV